MVISYSNFYSEQQKVKIIEIDELVRRGGQLIYEVHKLDFYGFVFVKEGAIDLEVNNEKIEVKKGEVFFTGPGQFHRFIKPISAEAYVVSFMEEFILTNVKNDTVIDNFKLLLHFSELNKLLIDASTFNIILHLLQSLQFESRNSLDKFQTPVLQNILCAVLYLLERTNSQLITEDTKVNKYYRLALNYKLLVAQHIRENNTLQYYLDKLNVSQSTLQIATKTIFHTSPKTILDDTLIFCAKRLLADPCKRIQEIGYDLGFSEATNFSKFFKKHTGYTPENYRIEFIKFV